MNRLTESPIPDAVRAVLALFEGPLAEVRFPQVDRETLADQAAVVEQRRAVLHRALEAVQVARTELEAEQRALLDQARRAHAYARVFAEGDAALSEQIGEIHFGSRPPAPAKKRGRKPKSKKTTSPGERPLDEQPGLAVSEDAA
ncbi:MAG: hypothetical protein R6X02_20570 [Enhygromyxa sp.]